MLFSNLDAQIRQRASLPGNVLSPSREMLPYLRGGGSPTVLTNMAPMGTRMIPPRPSITSGIGGTPPGLPIGRGTLSPIAANRANLVPPSTLAPASAFGGRNGGMGAGSFLPATSLGPTSIGGIGSSITSAGTGIINTVGQYIPLAIKIILAVIVIKIVLWLVKGRKR